MFRAELGTLRGVQAKLEVKPDARSRFYKPHSVPYAIKEAIEKDLERLDKAGVLEMVKFSVWAAPIVSVPKSDRKIRICGDYKVTINPVLQVDQYPMPTLEDLFAKLAGGQTFYQVGSLKCLQPSTFGARLSQACDYKYPQRHSGYISGNHGEVVAVNSWGSGIQR